MVPRVIYRNYKLLSCLIAVSIAFCLRTIPTNQIKWNKRPKKISRFQIRVFAQSPGSRQGCFTSSVCSRCVQIYTAHSCPGWSATGAARGPPLCTKQYACRGLRAPVAPIAHPGRVTFRLESSHREKCALDGFLPESDAIGDVIAAS
jgi:hypothetical protein